MSTQSTPKRADIFSALELSTSNVSEETALWLGEAVEQNSYPGIAIYGKAEYGWFVHVPEEVEPGELEKIPTDLYGVLMYAKALGCRLVMFDMDAEPNADLPEFDW